MFLHQASRVTVLPFIIMAFVATVSHSRAAEVRVLKTKNCYALLSGPIEKGDAKKVTQVFEAVPWNVWASLCLDSSGGSYREALEVMNVLMDDSGLRYIGTVINKGMKCSRACAIAFLGGSTLRVEEAFDADRTLHEEGVLEFGLPSRELRRDDDASRDDLMAAYNEGIDVITQLLSLQLRQALGNFIPYAFLSEVLALKSDEVIKIKNRRELAMLVIRVINDSGECKHYGSWGHEQKIVDC